MSEESKGAILPAGLIAVIASTAAASLLMACGSDDARTAMAAGAFLSAESPPTSGSSALAEPDDDASTPSLPAVSRHFAIYRLSRPVFDDSGGTSGLSKGSNAMAEETDLRDGSVGDAVAACSMRAMIMQE